MTRVELTTARREYDRLSKLAATNNVAAQRLDQARDQIAQAEARIASQDAAIQTAQSRLAEARYNQELTIIRAPMDGRITRRYAQPGAGASTLNVTAMFDLEPDTARIVRAEIVEADIPNVAVGQEVELTPGRRSRPRSPWVACCAAPPSSAPASFSPKTLPPAPTNGSSRSWSLPTTPPS